MSMKFRKLQYSIIISVLASAADPVARTAVGQQWQCPANPTGHDHGHVRAPRCRQRAHCGALHSWSIST